MKKRCVMLSALLICCLTVNSVIPAGASEIYSHLLICQIEDENHNHDESCYQTFNEHDYIYEDHDHTEDCLHEEEYINSGNEFLSEDDLEYTEPEPHENTQDEIEDITERESDESIEDDTDIEENGNEVENELELEEEFFDFPSVPFELNFHYNENILNEEIIYLASFLNRKIEEINKLEILYDINGEESYLLAIFDGGGYVIMRRGSYVVFEYSYNADNPYNGLNSKLFYLNILSYWYESNNNLYDIKTGNVLTKDQRKIALDYDELIRSQYNTTISSQIADSSSSYNNISPYFEEVLVANDISNANTLLSIDFGENVNGTCGPLAISILMYYYNQVYNIPIVPFTLTGHKDDSLHQYVLNNYAKTNFHGMGTFPSDDAKTSNYYLGDDPTRRNLGYHVKYQTTTLGINRAINEIDKDRPVLLYTVLSPTYHEHVVVAYGYEERYSLLLGYTEYFKIHSGWHSDCVSNVMPEIFVSPGAYTSYGGVAWLEQYSSHNHKFEILETELEKASPQTNGHYFKCTGCELVSFEDHSWKSTGQHNSLVGPHKLKCEYCDATYNCTAALKAQQGTTNPANVHDIVCPTHGIIGYSSHSFNLWNKHNDQQHKRTCFDCGYTEYKDHIFNQLYSTTDSTHSYKCSTCDTIKATDHRWDKWNQGTENVNHSRKCLDCNRLQSGSHTWGVWTPNFIKADGHDRSCTVCGLTNTKKHNLTNWKSVNSYSHQRGCNDCSYTETVAHNFGSWSANGSANHKQTCTATGCGYANTANHSFSSWTKHSSTQHKRTCSLSACNYTEYSNHSIPYIWIYHNDSQHKKECSVSSCNHVEYANHNWSYGTWYNVGTMFVCQRRTNTCMSCNRSVTEEKSSHNVINKICQTCKWNRGF